MRWNAMNSNIRVNELSMTVIQESVLLSGGGIFEFMVSYMEVGLK